MEMRVRVKNPYRTTVGQFNKEMVKLEDDGFLEFGADYPDKIREHYKNLGYDALDITDQGYLNVFDPENVAIYEKHKNSEEEIPKAVSDRLQKEAEKRGYKPFSSY